MTHNLKTICTVSHFFKQIFFTLNLCQATNDVSNSIICNNFLTVHFVYLLIEKQKHGLEKQCSNYYCSNLLIEKQKHGLKNSAVIFTAVIINYYCCILILICSSRNEHEQ